MFNTEVTTSIEVAAELTTLSISDVTNTVFWSPPTITNEPPTGIVAPLTR